MRLTPIGLSVSIFSLLTCLFPIFSLPLQACGHLLGRVASLKAKIMRAYIVYSIQITVEYELCGS